MSSRPFTQGSKSKDIAVRLPSDSGLDHPNRSFNYRILKESRQSDEVPAEVGHERVSKTINLASSPFRTPGESRQKEPMFVENKFGASPPTNNVPFLKQQSALLIELANMQEELDRQKERNGQLEARLAQLERHGRGDADRERKLEQDNRRLQALCQKQAAVVEELKVALAQKDHHIRRISDLTLQQQALANQSSIAMVDQTNVSGELRDLLGNGDKVKSRYGDSKRSIATNPSQKQIKTEVDDRLFAMTAFSKRSGDQVEAQAPQNKKTFTFKNPVNGFYFNE